MDVIGNVLKAVDNIETGVLPQKARLIYWQRIRKMAPSGLGQTASAYKEKAPPDRLDGALGSQG
jgi:hypothetical protein